MPATLRSLLNESRFDLRPVSGVDDALLSEAVLWAHSSDLPDPTPWLASGGLLLTDGVQFGAFLGLDLVNGRFQPVALGGDRLGIVDLLLAQARFQRIARRLVDARPNFGIGAFGTRQRVSDCRFQSAHIRPFYGSRQRLWP